MFTIYTYVHQYTVVIQTESVALLFLLKAVTQQKKIECTIEKHDNNKTKLQV